MIEDGIAVVSTSITYDGSSWNETKLTASDGAINDRFGETVSVSNR